MLWNVVSVLVLLVAALLLIASSRPGAFTVQRSIRVNAPPDRIFSLINDFHSWALWSPYEKLDPAMKKTFSGAPSGVGAIYEWLSAGKAGAGRMEITAAPAPTSVTIKLDFSKPFEANRGVHVSPEWRRDGRLRGYARPEPVHVQTHGPVSEHG
jgi:hypothetical protein